MKLVFIENNRPVTDSLTIAETFGKRHDDVLRAIRNLECSEEFSSRNFAETPYVHEQNRQTYQKYIITQDGFSFLVMGFTGSQAAQFKEMYINEFNRMKNEIKIGQLHNQFKLPQTFAESLRMLAAEIEEKEAVMAEKHLLENTLDSQRPLVAFAETCMDSERNLLVREVAKLASKNGIMIGEKRLYQKLREWGMVFQHRTEPTQRAMEMGMFHIKKGVTQTPKGARDYETAKVTPKGQVYIIDRLKREQVSESA